ncbi:MAG: hypothetical protein RL092_1011 [Bacteroidota bacterium]|jgi:uncharacterized membrane protein
MFPLILVGPLFVVISLLTWLFPPKKINGLYGYRTRRSMSNQKAWDAAQKISSQVMFAEGVIMSFFAGLGFLLNLSEGLEIGLSLTVLLSGIVFLLVYTEKKIKDLK